MREQQKTLLVLASRLDAHADAIVSHCHKRQVPVIRIDVEDFWPGVSTINWGITNSGSTAILEWGNRKIDADSVGSIYCRDFAFAKCNPSAAIETQLVYAEAKAALYGFLRCLENRYWMNPPWHDEMADNKPYQMECARNIGLTVPETLVTNDVDAFLRFYEKCEQDVIIKQLSEICLIDDSELQNQQYGVDAGEMAYGFYTNRVLPEHLNNIDEILTTPCLFQKHIPKKADIRVTIVCDRVFSALIDSQNDPESKIDFRLKPDLPVFNFELPDSVTRKLLPLIRKWNLEFAACDFVLTPEEELIFIEANVEGNWLWIEHELGLPISRTIAERLLNFRSF